MEGARVGMRGRGDGEVGAGAAAQGGSCGSARWKTQLLQHPPVPAQPGMLSTPGGEWSTATSREICRALSWHYLGKGFPQNLFPYSSVLALGLVGLAQLFRGGDGPSRGWGRNRFLLRGCLGWKNWETGGSHAAGTWNRCLAPPPVLLPLLGKTSWGGNGAGARCPRLAGCWSRRPPPSDFRISDSSRHLQTTKHNPKFMSGCLVSLESLFSPSGLRGITSTSSIPISHPWLQPQYPWAGIVSKTPL